MADTPKKPVNVDDLISGFNTSRSGGPAAPAAAPAQKDPWGMDQVDFDSITKPAAPAVNPVNPAAPQPRVGFMEGLNLKLAAGTATGLEGLTEVPQFIESVPTALFHGFMKSMVNRRIKRGELDPIQGEQVKKAMDYSLPDFDLGAMLDFINPKSGAAGGFVPKDQQTLGEAAADSKVNKWLNEAADKYNKSNNRYDNTVTGYLANHQYGKALGAEIYGVAESLPSTLLAAMGGPGGAAALGIMTGAQTYDGVKDREDMAESMKVVDGLSTGLFEALFEYLGTAEMSSILKNAYKSMAKDQVEDAVKNASMNLLSKAYKKFGVWFAPVHEGLSEALTQWTQNLSAIYTGEDPERTPSDGVVDALLIGMGMGFGGAGFTKGMQTMAKYYQNKKIQDLTSPPGMTDNAGGNTTGPLAVPPAAQAQYEAEMQIHEQGKKLKYGTAPLEEDESPVVKFATGRDGRTLILKNKSSLDGNDFYTAYDAETMEPTMIKASDIKGEIVDMSYQDWLAKEINQYHDTQAQLAATQARATAPVQEGQDIQLKDKRFLVSAVDPSGIMLNEIDEKGNVTGGQLTVTPDQYDQVFGQTSGMSDQTSGGIPAETVPVQQNAQDQGVQTDQPAAPAVSLPTNNKGEIEFDKIPDPERYAQGLKQEFGQDAPGILDEMITEQTTALGKAKKGTNAIERARKVKSINQELYKLNKAKEYFPQAQPVEPAASPAAAEQPVSDIAPVTQEVQPQGQQQGQVTQNIEPVAQETTAAPAETAPEEVISDLIGQQVSLNTGRHTFIGTLVQLDDGTIAFDNQQDGRLYDITRDPSANPADFGIKPKGQASTLITPNETLIEIKEPQERIDQIHNTIDESLNEKVAKILDEGVDENTTDADMLSVAYFIDEAIEKLRMLYPDSKYAQHIEDKLVEFLIIAEEEYEKLKGKSVDQTKPTSQPAVAGENKGAETEPTKPHTALIAANQQVEARPTEAQKKAGNYQKGHFSHKGFDISIENAPETIRSGVDQDGERWQQMIHNAYGYFRRTKGKDGDQVDVFLGNNLNSDRVFVVDQVKPGAKSFDEHKVMLFFDDIKQAELAYRSNYSPDWKGLGAITEMSMDEFKKWLGNGTRTKKPVSKEMQQADLPVKTLKPKQKRSGNISPESRTGKALAIVPQDFTEAVLQFFLGGGRIATQDLISHTGYNRGDKDFNKLFGLHSKDGTRLDVIHEALPNSFGIEKGGAMDATNAVIDIIKNFPSRGKMLEEMERRIAAMENTTPNDVAPEDDPLYVEQDLQDAEGEMIEVFDDIMKHPEVMDILKEYSEDNAVDVDKLLSEIDSDPGRFTTFPFALRKSELEQLKTKLNELQRGRNTESPKGTEERNQAPVQGNREVAPGSGQADEGGTVGKTDSEPAKRVKKPKQKKPAEFAGDYLKYLPGSFVRASDGTFDFGFIKSNTGLTEAPIRLTEGNDSHGLFHIEKQHGKEIRSSGYKSVPEFIEEVAKNYSIIRAGNIYNDNPTYLLELTDNKNHTLVVELSKNGEYWNVNSAGIFRKGYSKNKEVVWSLPAVGIKESAAPDNVAYPAENKNGSAKVSGNSSQITSSEVKDTSDKSKSQVSEDKNSTSQQKPSPALVSHESQVTNFKDLVNLEIKHEERQARIVELSGREALSKNDRSELNQLKILHENAAAEIEKNKALVNENVITPDKAAEIRKLIRANDTAEKVIADRILRLQDQRNAKEKSLQKRNEIFGDRKAEEEKQSGMQPMFAGDIFNNSSEVLQSALKPFNDGIKKAEEEIDRNNHILDQKIAEIMKGSQAKMEFEETEQDPLTNNDGTPKTLYHGTDSNFKEFRTGEKIGKTKEDQVEGIYLTDNKEAASFFGNRIIEIILILKNPYITEGNKELKEDLGVETLGEVNDKLKSLGYDGLIINRGFYAYGGPHKAYIAFSPDQIKMIDPEESNTEAFMEIDKQTAPKLEDFGQKVGGARKDMEITRKEKDTDSLPAWRRKYFYANADGTMTLGAPVDTSKPFIVQYFKEVTSWTGKTTRTYILTAVNTNDPMVFKSEEEAESYIPIYEVWKQKFSIRKKGDAYKIIKLSSTGKEIEYGVFPTEEDASVYMLSTEGATSLLNHKREDFSIPALDKVERSGKDWRKGNNISTEEFMKTFGFRGGEFGNWVKPEERRVMLNAAYDSFMDMAELLGIPPRALSLGGELSIAFGARGTMGAAAHYEPDRAVINLTRMNGAGSLAHEWAHAMDNYFGLQGAKKDYSRNEKGEVKAGRIMRTEAGLLSIQGMRKELSDLFDKIIDATQQKSVTRKMGIEEKQIIYDKAQARVKSEADSLLKKFENGVRRYQYNRKTKKREDVVIKATPAQIDKLNGIISKMLKAEGTKPTWSRIPGSKGMGEYSYISPETLALEELHKEIFNRSGLKRDGNGFYNLGYFSDKLFYAKTSLDKAMSGDSETLTIATDFLNNSKKFDRSRAQAYWSKKLEMFARAFEYFLQTKLDNKNQRADYLQYDKAPVYDAIYDMNPYPAGEERAAINKLFDEFFKTLKVREENSISLLYETAAEYLRESLDGYKNKIEQNKSVKGALENADKLASSPGNKIYSKVKERTVYNGFKESGYVDFVGTKITGPQDIADLWSIHRSPYIEKSHVIFLKDGAIVGSTASTINKVGRGLFISPSEMIDLARKYGATDVYLLHNHPSGDPRPSGHDVFGTREHYRILGEAGINVVGQIVIDTDKFCFIDPVNSPIPSEYRYVHEFDRYTDSNVQTLQYKNAVPKLFSEREVVITNSRMLQIGKALLSDATYKGAIIYVSSANEISAYDPIPDGATPDDIVRLAKQGIANNLGRRVVFVHDGTFKNIPSRELPAETVDVIDIKAQDSQWFHKSSEQKDYTSQMQTLWESKPSYTQTDTPEFKKWFGNSKVVDENGKPLVVYHGTPIGGIDIFDREKSGIQSSGLKEHGLYFTTNPALAEFYAKGRTLDPEFKASIEKEISRLRDLQGQSRNNREYDKFEEEINKLNKKLTPQVYPVYLKMEKMFEFDADGQNGYDGWRNLKIDIGYKVARGIDAIEALKGLNRAATGIETVNGIKAKNIIDTHSYPSEQEFIGDVYLLFDGNPSNIKSATGNNGNFDVNNTSIVEESAPDYQFAGEYLDNTDVSSPGVSQRAAEQYKERTANRTKEEIMAGIREYIQDLNLPVRYFEEELVRRGMKQDNDSKPYRDMFLSFGRQEELLRQYSDGKFAPIIETVAKMKKAGIPGEEILPYIISKHAIERNSEFRKREFQEWINGHPDAPEDKVNDVREALKDKDYSGVMGFDQDENGKSRGNYTSPDKLAADIVKEFEDRAGKEITDELWDKIRAASETTLDTWVSGNQISSEQRDQYKQQFKYFVPLRGWRHGVAKELIYSKGNGFGSSLVHAEGRKSLADNPLAYMMQVQFQAIGEQVENEYKNSMYNLILKNLGNNEIHELATLKKLYYVKVTGADGVEEWEPTVNRPSDEMFKDGTAKTKIYREHEKLRKPSQSREHEVVIHKPGGDIVMVFTNKYLPVAQALNKQNYLYRNIRGNILDARDVNKLIKGLSNLNNGLKALYTSWNLVFPFTNFIRDFQEATISQSISAGLGTKTAVNYKNAFPALVRRIAGRSDITKQVDRDLQDFYNYGGATGYTHNRSAGEIESDIQKQLTRMVRKGTISGTMIAPAHFALSTIEHWNKIFEDAPRFSVYLASLSAGHTKQDAAYMAKEASVNFNRKGKGSKTWDAIYAFFNVAIQSLQKNFKLAKDHPGRFATAATAFITIGFVEALVNALTDDPDDPDSSYYNLNPYMRQNYLVIPNVIRLIKGEEKGDKYLSVPLPQFWRGFKSIGTIAFDVATGKLNVGKAMHEASGNFLAGLLPIDIGGLRKDGEFSWAPIVPTVIKPFAEVWENRNYMGYTIANEPFTKEQEKFLANASLGKNNVSPAAKFFTDMLFRWGGGDSKFKYYYDKETGEQKKVLAVLDMNPSVIEHLFKGYTGGTGGFLSDLVTTTVQAVKPDQEVDFRNAPFVNRFIRKTPEAKWNIIAEYYNLRDDDKVNSALQKLYAQEAEGSGDWSKVYGMEGNDYLQQYHEIFGFYEKELEGAAKDKKYDFVEGSEYAIKLMKDAIAEIHDLKKKYNK